MHSHVVATPNGAGIQMSLNTKENNNELTVNCHQKVAGASVFGH